MCVLDADGAAAVESLRAELARAKEQARESDVAAKKALEELRAEQAAHRLSEGKIAEMTMELKNATNRYDLLEKENQVNLADLKKALDTARETRSESRYAWKEICQAREIAAGNPYLLRM